MNTQYAAVFNEFAASLKRPKTGVTFDTLITDPMDFAAVTAITSRCGLSLPAALCLWALEKCIHCSPAMRISFNDKHSMTDCWAALSDSTGRDNNIHKNRFMKWVKMSQDWESFYKSTQEFLRLAKLSGLEFSHRSLYDAIALRDKSVQIDETGLLHKVSVLERFNVMMINDFISVSQ